MNRLLQARIIESAIAMLKMAKDPDISSIIQMLKGEVILLRMVDEIIKKKEAEKIEKDKRCFAMTPDAEQRIKDHPDWASHGTPVCQLERGHAGAHVCGNTVWENEKNTDVVVMDVTVVQPVELEHITLSYTAKKEE
jgi:hypothetical protein